MGVGRLGRFAAAVAVASVIGGVLVVASAGSASAAPPGPPDYGVVEPSGIADKACPWPDSENDSEVHADAQKCLPTNIPWSGNDHGGVTYGVRIISDDLADSAGAVKGQVTFRCQSRVGFQYKVTVQSLQARTEYSVEALQLGPVPVARSLGSFTTDRSGNGILNGTLHLDGGGYGFLIFVKDASGTTVLSLAPERTPSDTFVPGVVGLAVLDDPASPEYRL